MDIKTLNNEGWMQPVFDESTAICRRCGALVAGDQPWTELHVAWHMGNDNL